MTPDINFYAIIDEIAPVKQVVYYTNPNQAIVFGNFTLEESSIAQGVPRPTSISVATQTTNEILPNYPVPPPPLYFRKPIPCSRCGHLSHTVENCVAKWNVNGERIPPTTPKKLTQMYPQTPPISPSHSETHYYNTHLIQNARCEQDKTDYTQFIFNSEDIYDWIEEQQETFVPPLPTSAPPPEPPQVVYVPFVIRNKTRYAPVVIPSADQEVDYILRYNYAMTDYMLGRQAAYAY